MHLQLKTGRKCGKSDVVKILITGVKIRSNMERRRSSEDGGEWVWICLTQESQSGCDFIDPTQWFVHFTHTHSSVCPSGPCGCAGETPSSLSSQRQEAAAVCVCDPDIVLRLRGNPDKTERVLLQTVSSETVHTLRSVSTFSVCSGWISQMLSDVKGLFSSICILHHIQRSFRWIRVETQTELGRITENKTKSLFDNPWPGNVHHHNRNTTLTIIFFLEEEFTKFADKSC